MGTGEALPHLAPLHCPPARVFAHNCIARMCALHSYALFALPSCVIAALMLCVCLVRRRSMWCNGACKAAGWACGVQLERAGMGREVSLNVRTPVYFDANSQTQLCAACAVRPVWTIAV